MPIYCHRCPACGNAPETFEHSHRPPGPKKCDACGRMLHRDYRREFASRPAAACGEIRSVAAGVMPPQARQATAAMQQRGISGVRFDPRTGDAIFAGRADRIKALRAMGLHDKNEIKG
jgi:hypothetical protein